MKDVAALLAEAEQLRALARDSKESEGRNAIMLLVEELERRARALGNGGK